MSELNDNLELSLEAHPNEGDVTATIVNMSQTTANDIHAERVRISQGGANTVTATDVEISQGGASQIKAQKMTLAQGGAGLVQAVDFDLREGGVGLVNAENATIHNSGIGAVYGQAVDLQEGTHTGVVVARQVNAANTQTKVLLAGKVEGDVVTLMDTRQAALAGLGFGTVVGMFVLIAGWLRRGK
jgi:hypothetical protein